MIAVNRFFEDIFGGEKINFRCIKSNNKSIDAYNCYDDNTLRILQQANGLNYECYFVVNTGGYKNTDIERINAVFIDLDCGRNDNGQYYPLNTVSEYKQKMLNELDGYENKPTYIVQTRNGLQCYWVVSSDTTIEQFKICEERLIAYFKADKKVKNPARMLRVPETHWCKDINNKFLTTIIKHNDSRYDVVDLINSLPVVDDVPQEEEVS